MPTVLNTGPYRFFFFAGDRHEPPHIHVAQIQDVRITEETLTVDLSDGRTLAVPLAWYPRLLHGTQAERSHWKLSGQGQGIYFPDLDEDISVENIIAGMPSGESQRSLGRWIEKRNKKTE